MKSWSERQTDRQREGWRIPGRRWRAGLEDDSFICAGLLRGKWRNRPDFLFSCAVFLMRSQSVCLAKTQKTHIYSSLSLSLSLSFSLSLSLSPQFFIILSSLSESETRQKLLKTPHVQCRHKFFIWFLTVLSLCLIVEPCFILSVTTSYHQTCPQYKQHCCCPH